VLRYLTAHVAAAMLNVAVVVSLVFVLVNVLPSDPARVRLGVRYNERDAAAIRSQYGLDRPVATQYFLYLGQLARGQLGTSITTGEPIGRALTERLPQSLVLILFSLVWAVPWAFLGGLGALRRSRLFGIVEATLFSLSAVPVFVLGAVAVFVAIRVFGVSLMARDSGLGGLQLVVPSLLLAVYPAFALFKVCRDTLTKVLGEPYIRAHRALGLPELTIVFPLALRNVGLSLLSITTNLAAYYLTSIYAVEFIFSLGGIGGWAVGAAQSYDVQVVLATVVVTAVIYNAVGFATSALGPLIDPRVLRA
jgi:peptide/nickel transport system permease protein